MPLLRTLTSATLNSFKVFSANSKSVFVSRGDESGTHKKELKIWQDANIDASKLSSDIYYSVGKGMGDTLTMTSEKQAYTLTDKATYLSMKDKLKLDILLEESEDLKNKRRAASSTQASSNSKTSSEFNPLAMSDAEFEKLANAKYL